MVSSVNSAAFLTARMDQLSQARVDASSPTQWTTQPLNSQASVSNVDSSAYSTLMLKDTVSKSFELTGLVQIKTQALDEVAKYLTDIQTRVQAQAGLVKGSDAFNALESQIRSLEAQLSHYVGTQINEVSQLSAKYSEVNDLSGRYFSVVPGASSGGVGSADTALIEVNLKDLITSLQSQRQSVQAQDQQGIAAAPAQNNNNVTGSAASSNSNVSYIEALRMGPIWQLSPGEKLSYSYYDAQSPAYVGYPAGNVNPPAAVTSVMPFASDLDKAFALWDRASDGLSMERVTEAPDGTVGELRVAYTDSTQTPAGSAAYAYGPGNGPVNGDIWFDRTQASNQSFTPGSYGFMTALHEMGHALGLSHPFDASSSTQVNLSAADDNLRNTLMSYTNTDRNLVLKVTPNGQGGWTADMTQGIYSSTPMVYDVAAIEYLYGATTDANAGDTVYQWSDQPQVLQTLVDSSGNDTMDASNQTKATTIDLNPGHFSSIGRWSQADQMDYYDNLYGNNTGMVLQVYVDVTNLMYGVTDTLYTGADNVGIAYSASIENAVGGSGDDTLIGNALDNTFTGNAGNDTITGGAGMDKANYSGNFADYTLTQQGGNWVIADRRGINGTDVLSGVEKIEFSDLTWSLQDGSVSALKFVPDWSEKQGYVFARGYMTQRVNDKSSVDLMAPGQHVMESGKGNDVLVGGAGVDTVRYANAKGGMLVDLGARVAQSLDKNTPSETGTDVLVDVENVIGSAYADLIVGNEADNVLQGQGGADTLDGGEGNDVAIFAGNRYDYALEKTADGYKLSRDGVTTLLRNVEMVQFDGGVYRLVDPKAMANATKLKFNGTPAARTAPVPDAQSIAAAGAAYAGAIGQIDQEKNSLALLTLDLENQVSAMITSTLKNTKGGAARTDDQYFSDTIMLAKNAIVKNTIDAILIQANTSQKEVLSLLK